LFKNFKIDITETMPDYLVSKLRLLDLNESLHHIHFPASPDMLNKAQFRLKFEELFYIQLNILKQKFNRVTLPATQYY